MTESDLIAGCIREERRCQEELFARYGRKMMTVCLRYARHSMEAEDILQDAFIKIFDNIGRFEGKGSFEGWIRRVVVNTALKNISRLSFKMENTGLESTEEGTADPSVFSTLSAQELLNLVAQLPEGYRIVFNLYCIEGFSHREIAETLHIEESTSRSQLTKARHILQQQVLKLQKILI